MPALTKDYLDQKFGEQTRHFEQRLDAKADEILLAMKAGLDEHTEQINELRQSVATLTESVDRFVKIMSDVKQEAVVLRKQLNDLQDRVTQLETKI